MEVETEVTKSFIGGPPLEVNYRCGYNWNVFASGAGAALNADATNEDAGSPGK
jgi:hypothetical protein